MFKYSLSVLCCASVVLLASPISLEDAISVALFNNVDIKTSQTNIDKSIEQRREAWSYILPKVDASINYNRAESFQTKQFSEIFADSGFGDLFSKVNEIATEVDVDPLNVDFGSSDVIQESYTYGIKVTQPLFSGEASPYIKASAIDILIQKNDLDQAKQQVMFDVLSAYISALSAYDQVSLTEESLNVLTSEHNTIKTKFNEGVLNKTDYLQSELAIESESLTLLQAKKNYRLALAHLKTLLNVDSNDDISVTAITLKSMEAPQFDVTSKIEDAYAKRNDIENAAYSIRVLELLALSQRRQKWPSFTAFGQYGYGNSTHFSMDDPSKDWYVGASGTLKLFTGFQYSAKQEQHQLDIDNALYRYETLEHKIATEVEESIYNFTIADQQKQRSQRQYELSTEIFEMQEISFNNGLISYDDYLDAVLDLKRAKAAVVKSNYGWVESLSRLYLTTGELNWASIEPFLDTTAFKG